MSFDKSKPLHGQVINYSELENEDDENDKSKKKN